MKNILNKLRQHRYFLLFILLFAYAHSIQIRLWVRGEFSWYIFTPDAAIGTLINACFLFFILTLLIKRWQKDTAFRLKGTFKIFGVSLVIYLVFLYVLSFVIAVVFNTIEKNFNSTTIIYSLISNLMDAFIYGSFFLAYYYYQQNKRNQKQISRYNQALSESKINQLKTQLNPHFLFNNLNVLDQLIEEDKQLASDFLNEFSEIYRYVLKSTDQRLVTIQEEILFASRYFKLMEHKYGKAYQLNISKTENSEAYIVPLTMQLLIENAIQHNLGTPNHPIIINIKIDDLLIVSNNINEKINIKSTSGKAIKNLKQQYQLLSNEKIEIIHSEEMFTVTLPLLKKDYD